MEALIQQLSTVGHKIKVLEIERTIAKEQLENAIKSKENTRPFEVLLECAIAELNRVSKKEESLKEDLKKAENLTALTIPDSQDTSPRRKAHIEDLKNLVFFTSYDNVRGCVTAFEKRRLVTFGHGMHLGLQLGDNISVYSSLDGKEYKAIVSFRDDVKDFMILETVEDACDFPPTLAFPSYGQDYIQFGFSAPARSITPLALTVGVFISNAYMAKTHHILGKVSNPGDFGAGCFSRVSNVLFGINVRNDSLAISDSTALESLGSSFPSHAHIVPSAFFV
ncbi:hypothetical protein BDR26DRAFT_861042 [Obelidium mucronatum]|nr:hypothetical protein BDR26DRAFT_861042 [Obelidium mucronatum]